MKGASQEYREDLMKAAQLLGTGKMEIREVPKPSPRDGEVLIRVREVGICGSDFSKYQGHNGGILPVIPGHEAVGEIAALGSGVNDIRIGERVALQPSLACGTCSTCLNGWDNICPNKIRLGVDRDGAFAEYVTAPRRVVWTLPDDLSFRDAVLTEPLAVVVHGTKKLPPTAEDRVLAYGTGTLGLFFLQMASLAGAHMTALNTSKPRLEAARQFGADTFSSWERLEAESPRGFTAVYETTGHPAALSQIVTWCAPGARILLVGLSSHDSSVPTAAIARKELLIQGTIVYRNEFSEAIQLLRSGRIRTDLFITHRYPLEKLPEALAEFRSPNRIKDVIVMP
jgi:2-desacetyl-2-hydroxyethyl bacteriochlorophyllide A dehydrogenase